ncbi:MAG: (E)-4-hydroxy-3-methylbut-2-enyl-diphosphate synthase [Chlorobi bacterium]|nr:(E)-4-hydroxy-3-methylbut-2-enyl-diphosphate synthase [Chlorobiota bacterium]
MANTINNTGFCENLFNYERNKTREVKVGSVFIGGNNPVRIQSMTTTDTLDAEKTAQQAIKIIKAGGEIVRITTQGQREARNLKPIKKIIRDAGYNTPIVADIHFNPNAALIAAQIVEKVRINPGNFTGDAKKFDFDKFDDKEFEAGLIKMKEKIVPFLDTCKKNNTAIRIGTNHGSLSDRIMSRFGDTPEGMVESCMEYLRICEENDFRNIVLSIKSSNTRVMVHTVRLLVTKMKQEGMNYPLHLGVTEAGSDDEGRIKSAVGSGALLVDGIGDTLRVSLTENPEKEIPVAQKLVNHILSHKNHKQIKPVNDRNYFPYEYRRRKTHEVLNVGGRNTAVVISSRQNMNAFINEINLPDFYYNSYEKNIESGNITYRILDTKDLGTPLSSEEVVFLHTTHSKANEELFSFLERHKNTIVLLDSDTGNPPVEQRAFILELANRNLTNPVIIIARYNENNKESFQIASAADTGILFLDGLADGLLLLNNGTIPEETITDTAFGILQASRVRFTKTEFISCPGCGRTLFDLQKITKEIKLRTKHLKGLKIGIMGCIVNGIGEMADADYGYVGTGPDNISLFKNKELVKKNIPFNDAVDELINLIKENGDWINP